MGTVFGDIIDGDQIEQAMLAMLKLRLPTYIDEVAQQREHDLGRGAYQYPKSWIVTREFDKWPENKLPCVIVISPGMVDEPVKRKDGKYTGSWYVALAVVVSARSPQGTNRTAKRYGAALRACVLQNATLEGALRGTRVKDWVSEEYDSLPEEESRYLGSANLIFTVEVDDVTNAYKGPRDWEPDEEDEEEKPEPEHSPDYGDEPTAHPDRLTADVTMDCGEED